jgi:hypothetical protein
MSDYAIPAAILGTLMFATGPAVAELAHHTDAERQQAPAAIAAPQQSKDLPTSATEDGSKLALRLLGGGMAMVGLWLTFRGPTAGKI